LTAGPLSGIRVLDFCHFLAGPYSTLALGELGADVVKVEDPDHPDEARLVGPSFVEDESLYFMSLNWGKRSLGVRLANRDGIRTVLDLAAQADVVVDNYRPGIMARFGLDHESLAAANPGIISCSLTGFGETGPYADRPGYDYTIQALSGVMAMTGEPDGPPGRAGISYVDHSGGLAVALAVCSALVERARTGVGRHIDLALLDVQVSMLTYLAAWQLNAGYESARTRSGAHPSIVPAQNFATSDGHIAVFVGNDPMWQRLVAAVGDTRLANKDYATQAARFAERDKLIGLLAEMFRAQPSSHWTDLLTKARVPCSPVNDLGAALQDDQTVARQLVVSADDKDRARFRHVRGPLAGMVEPDTRGAPRLGQDTRQVLVDLLGYPTEQIDQLIASGAVVTDQ
jgi:crotonobetainyl-CoA:carnitine CoA-transferase CaiB-like acyl-CoA transferase